MRRQVTVFLLAAVALPAALAAMPVEITTAATAHHAAYADLDVSLRLVGGTGAVMMPGRSINLTFQTNADAWVIIYNIDAEGKINLLYPLDGRPRMIPAGKVQFLPETGSGVVWETGGRTGIEYIHAIAVEDAERIDLDELYYLAQNAALPEEKRLAVDTDPFLAFNMIDEELVRDADRLPPATDYTYFYVNRKVDYPGYLCYQCHSPAKIPDPYAMKCTEVVIEKIEGNEGAGYPYPNLYAVAHMDEWYEDSEVYTYRAGDLGLDYDDYDYDESKLYLSVYYTGGYYPYYYGWYPSYWYGWPTWGWGVHWGSYWGWDIGFGWAGGGYWHHYPFYSWYPYGYYPHYYGWGRWGWGYCHHYDYCRYDPVHYPTRSLYAGRSFEKRPAIDYHRTAVKLDRTQALAASRLTRERTRSFADRSLERSELARRVARDRYRAGTPGLERTRYTTGRSRLSDRVGTYGTTTRGAATRSARARADERRTVRERAPVSDRSVRTFDRGSRGGGSAIERRIERTVRERDADRSRSGSQSARERRPARSREERYTPPKRTTREPDRSSGSRAVERSSPARRERSDDGGRSAPSKSRESSTRRSAPPSSPVSRPSGGSSSRGGSSGGSSSRGSSGGSSGSKARRR